MKKESTKMLFVRVPESWHKLLEARAEAEAQTMSSIAKRAIKEYLDGLKEISETGHNYLGSGGLNKK